MSELLRSPHSHVRDLHEASRQRHESVLRRLGLRHWTDFDRAAVARAHEAHLKLQLTDRTYELDSLQIHCPAGVYHPTASSSSTFLLRHLTNMAAGAAPALLEVGIGSGAVLLSLARQHGPGRYLGVDISQLAVVTARKNAARNGIDIEVRSSDLFAAVGEERFDAIFFNAPLYDREPHTEVERQMLCDPGGCLLERFVHDAPRHLKPGGSAFVTCSNIGLVAPLEDRKVRISLAGAELFDTGVMRALVRLEAP